MVEENSAAVSKNQGAPRLIPSTRFTLALLVFYAFVVQYSQRVNLPIGIVCMVNKTKISNVSTTPSDVLDMTTQLFNESLTTELPASVMERAIQSSTEKGSFFQEKRFHWSELQQQILLGSYWAGYIFTQVPGGWLATSIGAKWVYATSIASSSLATLTLTIMYKMPDTHFFLMVILRFIIGLAHGVLFPATIALWSLWAVPQERSTLASIGFCGTHLGTALTMLVGGVFCRYLSSGWLYTFFLSGVLGFIWLVLWIMLTADSPHRHKSISHHERNYICEYTGTSGKKRSMSLASIPWKNIVTSKPLNALMFTHIANLFGLFFFLTNFGKILSEILRIESQYTGYILCFGYLLTLTSSLVSGIVADRVVRANKITLTNARKLSIGLTSFIPALSMMILYFCDKDAKGMGIFAVLLFLAATGLGYGSGNVVNFADIVPAYSGIIFGIANTFASAAGVIGNIVAGIVITKPVLEQWRKLYIMFGIVYLLGGIVYIIYGSAVPRKWAKFQTAVNVVKPEEKMVAQQGMSPNEKI